MEQTLDFNYILDLMSHNYGLAGIFSNPGFGKTTLMMQIVDEMNRRNDGIALVMSNEALSKEHWIEQMQQQNLSTERVFIDDYSLISHRNIYNNLIKICNIENRKVSIVCVDSLDLMNTESIQELRKIAEKFKVLILVNGNLMRDSGDFSPDLRPEMYSIGVFRNQIQYACEYKFLALLHRKHKCERNIGVARRFDIQNETELIIKRNWDWNLGSAFIEWDDDIRKFRF